MTRGEHLAYSRGYQRGMRNAWGAHLPPLPPQEELRKLMEAAMTIRNRIDSFCATLDPDDEWVAELGPVIDGFDEAIQEFQEWMTKQ